MAMSRAGGILGQSVAVNAATLLSRPPQRGVEFGFQKH
jgi:hypothetical protein